MVLSKLKSNDVVFVRPFLHYYFLKNKLLNVMAYIEQGKRNRKKSKWKKKNG